MPEQKPKILQTTIPGLILAFFVPVSTVVSFALAVEEDRAGTYSLQTWEYIFFATYATITVFLAVCLVFVKSLPLLRVAKRCSLYLLIAFCAFIVAVVIGETFFGMFFEFFAAALIFYIPVSVAYYIASKRRLQPPFTTRPSQPKT